MRRTLVLLLYILTLARAFPAAQALAEPPVLRVALENEPLSLDWNDPRTPSDRFLASFFMRGLLKYDGAGKPVCDLCTSYRVSTDGKIYRFDLNPKELWSDGDKIDSSHFVDSFRRLLSPSHRFKSADEYRIIAGAEQTGHAWDPKNLEVSGTDPFHLEIKLKHPSSVFNFLLTKAASFPIRKNFCKGESGESMVKGPVLGPYQLAEWSRGRRIVIEGNPSFEGSRPVYRVDFNLGQHAEQLDKFKAGKLDILSNPTTEDLVSSSSKNLQVSPYWATRLLLLNAKTGSLQSSALRKAILFSLDRATLPSVIKTGERAVTGVVPEGILGYRELPLATLDLARAKGELSRVSPNPTSLTLLLRDAATDRAVAGWLVGQLSHIGLNIKLSAENPKAYYARIESGGFDLALSTWAFDIANPLDILKSFATGASLNRTGWTNVVYDSLLEQLSQEQIISESAGLIDQATQLLEVKEAAVIPLGYPSQPFLLGPRVISFAMTPFGDPDLLKIKLKQ